MLALKTAALPGIGGLNSHTALSEDLLEGSSVWLAYG